MNEPSRAQVEAARAYEALMVPALFGEWTKPVLKAAEVSPGQSVLDVACGTGVLARAAAKRAGPKGRVAGVDLSPGMLAVAAEHAPSVEWREGSAEALPFPDDSFDAVVSQFGLMFFADRPQAIREMGRVLRPDGLMAVAVWDCLENTPAYAMEVALLERMAGSAAADALRAPFTLGDPEALEALFEEAGAESPEVETRIGTARFPSVQAMVEADLRGWLPLMGVHLDEARIQDIVAAAEQMLAPFVEPSGKLVFDSPAHIVSALA